jgi:hypothetical protein
LQADQFLHERSYPVDITAGKTTVMATRQVVEHIKSWVSNRANEFAETVRGSKLPPETRKQLYAVNWHRAWFTDTPLKGVDNDTRVLAHRIMRHAMRQHRRPTLSRISPRLDDRITLSIARSKKAKHSGLWTTLRLPGRGRIEIPLHTNAHFKKRGGELCPSIQLCTEQDGAVTIRLISDITEKCEKNRAAYAPKIDSIGVDLLQKPPIIAKNWCDHEIPSRWIEKIERRSGAHPHIKPAGLIGRLIGAVTHPGDLVVDPCAGSFIVLDECQRLGRRFIGCDLAYAEIAADTSGFPLADTRRLEPVAALAGR